MKIDEATKDITEFVKKRLGQLRLEMDIPKPTMPAISVSFAPNMQIRTNPIAIPEIVEGMYQDHMETMHVEVIHVNRGNNIVQMEVLVDGQPEITKRFEHISTGLFSLMFKKAVIDPLA